MADIKTRESMRTVKTIDHVRSLAAKTRNGVDEAKQEIHDTISSGESSESEYAGNRLAAYESETAHLAVRAGDRLGRWGVRETRRNMQKRRSRPKKRKFEPLKLSALPAPGQPSLLKKNPVQTTARAAKTTAKGVTTATQKAVRTAKAAVRAIVAVGKATVAAGKGVVAAIAAGGWIAVLIIVIVVLVALVLGSVFGVFATNPDNENGITIVQTVCEANAEYEAQIAEIKNRYNYDMCFVTGEPCEWSLAIAVYAVKTNQTEDVVTFDKKKAEVLKEVYRSLNRISVHTEQVTVTETRLEMQEDGSFVPVEQETVKTYLYMDTVPLTQAEAADWYCFNTEQREQLGELLSDKNAALWDELLWDRQISSKNTQNNR